MPRVKRLGAFLSRLSLIFTKVKRSGWRGREERLKGKKSKPRELFCGEGSLSMPFANSYLKLDQTGRMHR